MNSLRIHGGVNLCWAPEELRQKGSYSEGVVCSSQKDTSTVMVSPLEVQENRSLSTAMNAANEKTKMARQKDINTEVSDIGTAVAIVASLKACAKQKDLSKGSTIHDDALRRGLLQRNVFVGSALVNMYAKCGVLDKAQDVFDGLSARNTVSWNALIAGYAQHGHGQKAIRCFEQMQSDGFAPDKVSFACALKACGNVRALDKGRDIHEQVRRDHILARDTVVGTALVNMYGKCGELKRAQEVFDELPHCNLISWNALISGYAENGHGEEALQVLERMKLEGFSPDAGTFVSLLKACGSIGHSTKGQDLHAQIIRERLLEKHPVLASTLVDMYVKCKDFDRAHEVFDRLPVKNLACWTSLISGYDEHGNGEKALHCFERMQELGFTPDAVTFACILKACGSLGALARGQEIHAQIEREHLLENHVVVANALVNMYAKCGALERAQEVFDGLPLRDIVTWNTLIAGYADHGYGAEALRCYEQMQLKGFCPNAITFACTLTACGSTGAVDKGKDIHAHIVKERLLEKDVMLGSALVSMYAKWGVLEKAQQVFDMLPVQNIVAWNVLIAGYAQIEHFEQVLKCLEEMQHNGYCPDAVTFACIMKACGCVGAANKGQEIHSEIVKLGILEKGNVVAVELLIMYLKCGMLAEAQKLFKDMPMGDEVTWSALMVGYAQLGKDEVVLRLFDIMVGEGVMPNLVTFTIILNACNHLGLLDMGELYFKIISKDYGIIPTLEHYTCMIDLFGRAGLLDQAVATIEGIPCSVDQTIMLSLLGSCQRKGNKDLMGWAFKNAVQFNEKDASAYVHMRNLLGAACGQEDPLQKSDLKTDSYILQG